MTNTNDPELHDPFMLELFRSEMETQTSLLSEGLLALERDSQSPTGFETLMRAAHSIKGAARMVELEVVVDLAHVLEDCFVAARQQSLVLGAEQLDVLLNAADQLVFLTEVGTGQVSSWLTEHAEEMVRATAALRALLQPHQAEPPRVESPLAAAPTSVDVAPPETNVPPALADSTPSSYSATDEGEAVAAAAQPADETETGDTFMLELFRSEVETQTSLLSEGLLALERNPQNAAGFEALMRAAHSIKGAARIVELGAVVDLTHALEDCFVAAQRGNLKVESAQLDVLLRATDLLVPLAKMDLGSLASWPAAHADELGQTTTALRALLQDKAAESAHAAPAAVTTPPPEPVSKDIPSPPEAAPVDVGAKSRTLRVTAANLSRLLGLAGEVSVESQWLQPFADSLLRLKQHHVELSETLTRLQAALKQPDGGEGVADAMYEARLMVDSCHHLLSEQLADLEQLVSRSANLSDRLYREALAIRMRPFADGVQGFPRMVRDLARTLGKQVRFDVVGQETRVDRDILDKLEAPLTHLLRNAIDHGIEAPADRVATGKSPEGAVCLQASHYGGMLSISVSDDGRGVDEGRLRQKIVDKQLVTAAQAESLTTDELIEFLFLPGFSTATKVTEVSGRGVGLDVVRSLVKEVGGTLRATSQPGQGMKFRLHLPVTLSVLRALLVEVAGELYAFPLARIDQVLLLALEDLSVRDDRTFLMQNDREMRVVSAHDLWRLSEPATTAHRRPVIVFSDQDQQYGFFVDALRGETDLVVRPLAPQLGKVPYISAAAVLKDGAPVLIVDVEETVQTIRRLDGGSGVPVISQEIEPRLHGSRKRILVVEDTAAIRTLERELLERNGYEVEVAADGEEGWRAVQTRDYDLLVTDVEMPHMNGLQLIANIKQDAGLCSLPIIVVSAKDGEKDRQGGLSAGAQYYLAKSAIRDGVLLQTVMNILGPTAGH